MTESISHLTVEHLELRQGSVARLPRHLTNPICEVLHRAMDASHHCRMTVAIEGTPWVVFSDLRCCSEGNSAYYVAANRSLGGGVVQPGSVLYIGVAAARLSTAPVAWRKLLQDYLSAAASARLGVKFSSFAAMPRHLPWAAGFLAAEANRLTVGERDSLMTIARLMAVRLAALGETQSRAAERSGRDFTPNPDEYPELL